jgi:mannose-6-phosphate isomerase
MADSSTTTTREMESCTRPWGSWHVLDVGAGYKVKRIHVAPGQRLSYQLHAHRSEHWVVLFGVATCIIDDETKVIGPGHSIDVSLGAKHRLVNNGSEDLVIIEVQRGGYTGEDDIVRLDDDYGRHDEEQATS